MSRESSVANPAVQEREPSARLVMVPVWMFVALFITLFFALYYFDSRSGWFSPVVYLPYHSTAQLQSYQPATGGPNLDRGRAVYENVCALCHNPDGTGKPNQAPTFVGSEWVTGSAARLIRIPLAGLTGPLQVKGESWNLSMPAMGASLPDEDLAAVLTYMRQSWGNKADAITPEQVKAVRAELGNRAQPFTAAELGNVP